MGSCGWKHWVILGLFWRTRLFLCKNKGNESSRAGEGEMVPCLLPPRCTPHPSVIGPGPRSCWDTAGGALGAKPGRSSPRLGLGALRPPHAQAPGEVGLGSGCPWGQHTPTWWAGSCVCPQHQGEGAHGAGTWSLRGTGREAAGGVRGAAHPSLINI